MMKLSRGVPRLYLRLRTLTAAILVGLSSLPALPAPPKDKVDVQQALNSLDKTIRHSSEYADRKQQALTMLSRAMAKQEGEIKCETAIQLSLDYRLFNADSSLYYARRALAIAQRIPSPELNLHAKCTYIRALSTLGVFSDAKTEFESINPAEVPSGSKEIYYQAARTLYSYTFSYLRSESTFGHKAMEKYYAYNDSMLAILPANSPQAEFLRGENLLARGMYSEAEKLELKLVTTLKHSDPLYPMTVYQLAKNCQIQGKQEKAGYYFAIAAKADIETCTRDGLALPELAQWLYQKGDLTQAYQYINVALEDASRGGVRWRAYALASMVPAIDEAYRLDMAETHRKLTFSVIVLAILVLTSAFLLRTLFIQRKKAHAYAERLAGVSALQDSYIGNFVAMCSSYADRLTRLTNLVDRKLSAGQADELKKMVKSGKLLENQDEDFYQIFDSAFLDLYPDFVDKLNGLLREEAQLEWRHGQPLSPELRIYALVRLGVSESTRISQILHYSVSTVYAYRNRMRNRARIRETFETEVLQLCHNR